MDIINPIVFDLAMVTGSSLSETDAPAWSSSGVYNLENQVIRDHKIYECSVKHAGVANDVSATVTFTSGTPGVVNWNAHGLAAGAELIFLTDGDLPTGIVAGTKYYVKAPTTNAFNLSASFAGGAIALSGTPSGTHTAKVRSTDPLTSSGDDLFAKWFEVSATNKYAAFDEKWGTQSVGTSSIWFEITPNKVIDSIAILNVIGKELTVECKVGATVIYTKTVSLISKKNVFDWKSWFLAPIKSERDITLTDLLPYSEQVIKITVTGTGTVAIGNISVGALLSLGELEYSPKVGIQDFSKIIEDPDTGVLSIYKGNYAKKLSGRIIIPNDQVDNVAGILASIRGTPVIWIGADYSALVIWGIYKDFEVDIKYPTVSYCSINLRGLV